MNRNDLLGVILAAGKGTRMNPFSEHYPKPILPIGGHPLISFQLRTLAELGIGEVVVVIGHLGYEIVRTLGDGSRWGVKIRYIEQGETLGIAHAVGQLEKAVDRPFMLFLGDIFFETDDLQQMVDLFRREKADCVLAVKEEPDPAAIRRNFVVMTDQADRVTRVIEKPRHPRTDLKGCGLYLFDQAFFDAIRRTPRTALRDEYEITDSIQIFVEDGFRVMAARVIRQDLNLSFPPDLLQLNLRYLQNQGLSRIVGKEVSMPEGTEIVNSIIMDRVEIRHPIRIVDSLLFPDRVVEREGDVRARILTPGHEVDCSHLFA
jgi:dTDP-glucose pyrophosphorylase